MSKDKEVIGNLESQVRPSHYYRTEYDTKGRFISYWHQINEVICLKPSKILEIGIGNKFVSNYLKERRYSVTTLDIDKRLNPNVIASVLNIPLPDESFDVIACYELLEHLPYEKFLLALREIFRVSKSYAILSLPDVTRAYKLNIEIPKFREIKTLIPLPRFKLPIHKFHGEHYWEIGKDGYPLNKIIDNIKEVGFKIERTYRVFETPYHRFFVLRK